MIRLFSVKVLMIIVTLGIGLSLFLGYLVHKQELEMFEIGFEKDVADKAAAIERELLINIEVLYAVKGLFDSSELVTLTEFTTLTQSFIARHPNIQALEWIPKVDGKEKSEFEAEIQQAIPSFVITERNAHGHMVPTQTRNHHFPVTYLTPFEGNEAALGFDLASSAKRFASLEVSRDSGVMTASASIRLVQEQSNQKSFLIFMPLYKGSVNSISQRRKALQGFVLGVFRIADIMNSAVARTAAEGLQLRLRDITDQDDLLYEGPVSSEVTQSGLSREVSLMPIGGRQWQLSATPSLEYESANKRQMSKAVALYGVVLVLVSGLYVYSVIRRKELIKQEVVQRTKDLNLAKEKLEVLSQTDSLTDVANRRLFDAKLEQEWARALREGTSITLIMIDIDCFKAYNDMYGHQAGDCCLCKVANSLKVSLRRPADVLARYGGEEFVILMPNTKNVTIPAKRCRADVEALGLVHKGSDVTDVVTVSVGGVSIIPTPDITAAYAISLADGAMYKAKSLGRNRVNIVKSIAVKRNEAL